MADSYGVTPAGFVRPRLPEIKQEILADLATEWGQPIHAGPGSVLGQLTAIYAERLAALWEIAESVYFAMYPNSAEDVHLDNAVAFSGVRRLAAGKTTVFITFYGRKDILVLAGTRVGNVIDASEYTTSAAGAISLSNAVYLELQPVVQSGANYSVTIDGTTYTHQGGLNSTAAEILEGLQAHLLGYNQEIKDGKLCINKDNHGSGWVVSLSTNLLPTTIGSPIQAKCTVDGAMDPAKGSLSNLITLISGVDRVSNMVDATVGRSMELTNDLRLRYTASVALPGSAMVDSIRAHLLQDVPGVTVAKVYENDTDTVDADGRQPHSLEIIVQGGEAYAIGKCIWTVKAGGISTIGSIETTVADSQGGSHIVRFSRPTMKKIWLKAVLYRDMDDELAGDTPTQVRSILLTEGSKLAVGQNVALQRLLGPVFTKTVGIGQIDLTAAIGDVAPDPDAYSAANIVIGIRELAAFDLDRIEVTVGG